MCQRDGLVSALSFRNYRLKLTAEGSLSSHLEDCSMTYDNARIEAAVLWLLMMVVLLIPWIMLYP